MDSDQRNETRHNRWKGYVIGLCGGLAGVYAMNSFMRETAEYFDKHAGQPASESDESMSLVGRQYQKNESPPEAAGRILYRSVSGQEPGSEELKSTLGQLVHWGYGMEMGGCYGFFRSSNGFFDLKGGLKYGAGLWLGGDAVAVPLLGLSSAPQSHSPGTHVQALAAHLVYGATTAATVGFLRKVFGR